MHSFDVKTGPVLDRSPQATTPGAHRWPGNVFSSRMHAALKLWNRQQISFVMSMASFSGQLAAPLSLSSSSSSLSGDRSRRQHLNWQTRRGFFDLASAARSCRSVAVWPLRALPATTALGTGPLEVQFNEVPFSLSLSPGLVSFVRFLVFS